MNVGPGEQVNFTSPWIGPTTANAGIYNLIVDTVATPSFCIDVANINNNNPFTDYYYSALSAAPLAPSGPMGPTAETDIEILWAQYFSPTMGNQDAAALQVAIWDVIAANASPSYIVTVNNNDLMDPIYGEAQTMIANIPSFAGTPADLVALVGPDGPAGEQTYVVAVPEPATVGCFLLGLGALAGSRRFAKK
ncbi:MAG: PEP-CTERM sorting domain-containing protein [Limisphaerales bacterium]